MRHLLLINPINPNTSTSTTERLAQTLRPLLPVGVQLTLRTATFGARCIACEASHAVAGAAAPQAWAEHLARVEGQAEPLQGVPISCFGDPGLFALRESNAYPVTGLVGYAQALQAQAQAQVHSTLVRRRPEAAPS